MGDTAPCKPASKECDECTTNSDRSCVGFGLSRLGAYTHTPWTTRMRLRRPLLFMQLLTGIRPMNQNLSLYELLISEVYLNSNLAGPTTPVKALFNFFPSWAFHHTWNISVSTHIKAPRELQPDHYFQLFFFSTTGDCLTEWILGWALHVCRCFMNRVFS